MAYDLEKRMDAREREEEGKEGEADQLDPFLLHRLLKAIARPSDLSRKQKEGTHLQ